MTTVTQFRGMSATASTAAIGRRRTKIVATLGPASEDPEVLERLVRAGVDVVRLNFSHGAIEEHARRVEAVRAAAAKAGRSVGVMGDLQGPKIRIQRFADGFVELSDGQSFELDAARDPLSGDATGVSVAYARLTDDVAAGDTLLLDDGQIVLRVDAVSGTRIACTVLAGGRLSDHKGLNKQGGGLSAAALTAKDEADIVHAAELGIDFLAVSFVRDATDIARARKLLADAGGDALLVAKIERAEAVDNIIELIDESDIIMVARGDLAVEVGYAELTALQKRILRLTRARGKVAITATQMMESMITHSSPTRAEVSDVANAVMDGTDAVMLSGETAVGNYPVEAVSTMAEVCLGAEKHQMFRGRTNHRMDDVFDAVDEAIAMAVMYTANHLRVKAIIAMTESGSTARWMSRVRSDIPIYAFTRQETTLRRVTMYRGVFPVPFDVVHTASSELYQTLFDRLLELELAAVNDLVIVTKGEYKGVSGGTNSMKILRVVEH